MCLTITEKSKKQTAGKDRVCYKILVQECDYNANIKYVTPFQRQVILIGCTYTSNLHVRYNTLIEIGLHSFARLKDAKRIISEHKILKNCAIVKCIIPKGSEYYNGLFKVVNDFDYPSYASTSIKYVKRY